jgi:hypothetical protein
MLEIQILTAKNNKENIIIMMSIINKDSCTLETT